MTKILEKIPFEFNWFSIDSQQFFVRKGHSHLVIAYLPSFILPGTERNLSEHVLLLVSTGSLDRETIRISSMREMYYQSY